MSKKPEIAKYILGTLAVAGLLTVAVVAPNLFGVFGRLHYRGHRTRKFSNRQLYDSLYNLKQKGLVTMKQEEDKIIIGLTKNGRGKLLKYNLDDMQIQRPKRWDKQWRLVIFDVPEKYKAGRDAFVFKLKELGFIQLQRSVWVYPYECEDEIDFIKELYEIRPFVRVVTAQKIDLQRDLVKKFKL